MFDFSKWNCFVKMCHIQIFPGHFQDVFVAPKKCGFLQFFTSSWKTTILTQCNEQKQYLLNQNNLRLSKTLLSDFLCGQNFVLRGYIKEEIASWKLTTFLNQSWLPIKRKIPTRQTIRKIIETVNFKSHFNQGRVSFLDIGIF